MFPAEGTACARALSHLQDVAGETLKSLQAEKCRLVGQGDTGVGRGCEMCGCDIGVGGACDTDVPFLLLSLAWFPGGSTGTTNPDGQPRGEGVGAGLAPPWVSATLNQEGPRMGLCPSAVGPAAVPIT